MDFQVNLRTLIIRLSLVRRDNTCKEKGPIIPGGFPFSRGCKFIAKDSKTFSSIDFLACQSMAYSYVLLLYQIPVECFAGIAIQIH